MGGSFGRIARAVAIMSIFGTVAGCAGRTLKPQLSANDAAPVSAPEVLVPGADLFAAGTCANFSDATAVEHCRLILQGRRFAPRAAAACTDLAGADERDSHACLRVVAEQSFGHAAMALCARFKTVSGRTHCFENTANRDLERAQIDACASGSSAREINRCLARAQDYAFHPWRLAQLSRAASRHRPLALETGPGSPAAAGLAQVRSVPTYAQLELHRLENQERMEDMLAGLQTSIAGAFPEVAVDRVRNEFIFNFAGGANGQYQLLYCSPKEYLIMFGAPMAVNGYSGRYSIHIYDYMLSGRMEVFRESEHVPRTYLPGSRAYLGPDDSKIYSTTGPTYMLEYGRGRIPSALDFGIRAPARAVTRDRVNMRRQVRQCARRALKASAATRQRKRGTHREQRILRRAIDRDVAAGLRRFRK